MFGGGCDFEDAEGRMSRRRSSIARKYRNGSPALRGLTNTTGIKSSVGAITSRPKSRKAKRKKVKSAPSGAQRVSANATRPTKIEAKAWTACPDCQCRLRVDRLEGHRTRCPK